MGSSSSYHDSSQECNNVLGMLHDEFRYRPQLSVNLTSKNMSSFQYCCDKLGDLEVEDKYSKPMVWVGMYVAIASLFCILAMVADLLHGFRKRKLWFPCKYFTLNAASITVMAVSMKLPMDLSSPMPSHVDQAAKMVSMFFMYTIVANVLPSLASMDNKTLVANVIGLDILFITVIGNICIEINTGVINRHLVLVYFYVVLVLWLLMLLTFSAIMIPTCKQILECKYQAKSKAISYDQHNGICIIEKLRQHVRRYWIMAETGSPQFIMASTSFSFVPGLSCVYGICQYIYLIFLILYGVGGMRYQSDYKWSIFAIIITQSVGIVVGSIAPIIRCFTVLSFSPNSFSDEHGDPHMRVKKYWTKNLYEWKDAPIPFPSSSRRLRTLIYNLRNFILNVCIGFQIVIGVFCEALQRFIVLIVIGCSNYWNSLKEMWCSTSIASNNDDANEDLGKFVLQLEDRIELTGNTLKHISNSMQCLMQGAEKKQPKNLLKLLEKSTGFEGVVNFDSDQVQPLLSVQLFNSWSLPVITLTCIAIALPNIEKSVTESLFKSVGEGIMYIHLVEENLNSASEYVDVQKAGIVLWNEIEHSCKWLNYTLERSAYEGKTLEEILKWFADTGKEIVTKIKPSTNGELVEKLPHKLIAANSMYRVAQTIMLTFQSNIEQISEEELFAFLSSMIADILSACLTNIPRVITTKCQESVIEKWEASVEAAAKILGKTTKIIERLEACELPDMDLDKMEFIDGWRSNYKQSFSSGAKVSTIDLICDHSVS